MVKLIHFLIVFVMCTAVANAQTTAKASAKGATATATAGNTTVTAKSDRKQATTSSRSSVSISDSDSSYTIHATFDKDKTAQLKKLLQENLGKENMTSKNASIWTKEEDGETAYTFSLSPGKLKVNVDKELVSTSTYEKFSALGERISETISGKD